MKKYSLVLIINALLLISCSSSQSLSSSSSASGNDENALLWQQTSGEYEAICYQTFHLAQMQLEKILNGGQYEGEPIVVMDLDETVLDNSPYNGKLLLENSSYEPETWDQWVALKKADLIPGAFDFIQFAQSMNVTVMFISNRDEKHLEATVANLNQLEVLAKPKELFLKRGNSSKSKRRAQVAELGDIVMFIGDNLADFSDLFEGDLDLAARKERVAQSKDLWGVKYIVLPNVMYGGWQKALQKDNTESIKNPRQRGAKKFIEGY